MKIEDDSINPVVSKSNNEPERLQKEKKLKLYNLICFFLHLIQAIALLILGLTEKSKNFKLPLTTLFLRWEKEFPVQDLNKRASLPFTAVTSGFSWLSALFHLLVLIFYKKYIEDLRKGINKFRWIEYAFSSSLMIGLIAMLFGMYDIISLVLIMSINACMNLFGYMMELHNQTTVKKDWTAFWFGCFAGAVPWACIFSYLGNSGNLSEIPGFVWGILIAYFIMFNLFPINMILQYKGINRWGDKYWGFPMGGYYFGELVYQVLSLVAKTLLVWLVFGGTNQPNPGIRKFFLNN